MIVGPAVRVCDCQSTVLGFESEKMSFVNDSRGITLHLSLSETHENLLNMGN